MVECDISWKLDQRYRADYIASEVAANQCDKILPGEHLKGHAYSIPSSTTQDIVRELLKL